MSRLLPVILICFAAATTVAAQTGDDAVREATLAALDARVPGASGQHDIRVVRIVGETSGALSVRLPGSPPLPRGRVQVRIESDSDPTWALVDIARFDSVALLRVPTSAGEIVDASIVRFAWLDVTRFQGTPLTRSSLRLLGDGPIHAARGLRADRPLKIGDLAVKAAADTGDPVRLTYRRGSINLELPCRARERGRLGEIIRLYHESTATTYRARLTDAGVAEWIETL